MIRQAHSTSVHQACKVHIRPVAPVSRRMRPTVNSFGKDAVEGWLDMAKLVAGSGNAKGPYEELASHIGRDIYVDIAGWHLFMRDMSAAPGLKMHDALAKQLGPQAANRLRESDVESVLKKIPVKLGAGKMQASLYDVMPSMCVSDLTRLLEEYGRK